MQVTLDAKESLSRLATAESVVTAHPDDHLAWINLSKICLELVKLDRMLVAAQRAVELRPTDVDAIRQLAFSLMQIGPRAAEAESVFEQLAKMLPQDPVALHYLYFFAILAGDYRRAIELMERLDRVAPGNPFTIARIGRAHQLLKDSAAAAKCYLEAADRCDHEQYPFPLGQWSSVKPLFIALAGDNSRSKTLSERLCREASLGMAGAPHPRYPQHYLQSVQALQRMMAGRDLFIFGNGPSLAEITSFRTKVADLDFSAMTMSSFQIIEQAVLHPIGKSVELVCITHPEMMRSQEIDIRSWMSSVPNATLVMPLWLRELATLTETPKFLLEKSSQLFWFDSIDEHLPDPTTPLHVPAVNTLLFALAAGVLARPRRIFMFGFDGQIRGSDSQVPGALYFNEQHSSYHTRRDGPQVREYTKSCLWWDSMRFNESAALTLRHFCLLFDLPQPLIYNVCPGSALTTFPRISFDRFCEVVSA